MGFIGDILSALFKPTTCCKCGSTGFIVNFGYDVSVSSWNMQEKRRATFCITHGLEELSLILKQYSGKILFAEPSAGSSSGSFFWEPDNLINIGRPMCSWTKDDKAALEEFLNKMPLDEGLCIGWLPKGVITAESGPPLFVTKPNTVERISLQNLLLRLSNILNIAQTRHKDGNFWITEPRGTKGIYIWESEV